MGDTGIPRFSRPLGSVNPGGSREPGQPAGAARPAETADVTRSASGAAAAQHAAPWPELAGASLSDVYYLPLLRLAALLTGDPATADAVAADALAAVSNSRPIARTGAVSATYADFAARLQREVVTRSRRSRHYRRLAERRAARLASWTEFAQLPVVDALCDLRASLREAVVLSYYLGLPAPQAAAIAGISESALRANLATAMHALAERLPAT